MKEPQRMEIALKAWKSYKASRRLGASSGGNDRKSPSKYVNILREKRGAYDLKLKILLTNFSVRVGE